MKRASPSDVEALVAMMAEFYAEADYPLTAARAREAFQVGARRVYHRAGFVDTDRQLLTLALAPPTHSS